MFATKMVSALTLTFFVLLTAGKMLGVPRKEKNRLRRGRGEKADSGHSDLAERVTGLQDSLCFLTQDKQGPEKQLQALSASRHPASTEEHRTQGQGV